MRRRRIAQSGALCMVLLGRDEQLAPLRLGRRIGVRPVARVGHRRAKLGILAHHRSDIGLCLVEHGRQLMHVVSLDGHVGGEDVSARW